MYQEVLSYLLGEPSEQNRASFPMEEERQKMNKYNMYSVRCPPRNKTEKERQSTGITTLNRVVKKGLFGE